MKCIDLLLGGRKWWGGVLSVIVWKVPAVSCGDQGYWLVTLIPANRCFIVWYGARVCLIASRCGAVWEVLYSCVLWSVVQRCVLLWGKVQYCAVKWCVGTEGITVVVTTLMGGGGQRKQTTKRASSGISSFQITYPHLLVFSSSPTAAAMAAKKLNSLWLLCIYVP